MAYVSSVPPVDIENLHLWLQDEFANIAQEFGSMLEIKSLRLTELNVEPVRPRDGMVVLADGTNWNPGSGAGFYGYRGGSWVLLG